MFDTYKQKEEAIKRMMLKYKNKLNKQEFLEIVAVSILIGRSDGVPYEEIQILASKVWDKNQQG